MPDDSQLENNENGFERNQKPNNLNMGQKIAAAILAIFAFLTIFLWAAQFKRNIFGPFEYKEKHAGTDNTSQQQEDSEESLKNKDTDGDGLSDWDELYFYKTSPYLEDSDSDGLTDKEEIEDDKDPNCPVGRDCYSAGIVDGDKSVVSEKSDKDKQQEDNLNTMLNQFNVNEMNAPQLQQSPSSAINESTELESLFGGQVDAATLRQLLLRAGMKEEILNQFSDEQLLESYKEILKR